MTIVIRTDASLHIGSGHVMRCLTLADELQRRGGKISFICREHTGNLIALIERKGYPVARLPNPECEYIPSPDDVAHAPWMGVPWHRDAAETLAVLEEMKPSWLIVDHYAIDRRWEEVLRSHVARIMVIDDLADRPHDCDLLLDQNLYQDMETRYNSLVPDTCKKLLGPRYALLRPEFAEARRNLRERDGTIRRILVFFGGVDQTNETEKALNALEQITDRRMLVDVVVGDGNSRREHIRDFCAVHDGFSFHCQVDNMAELMAAADLAIGAGGTVTWERCAVGLPSLVMAVANNQAELTCYGAERGLFFLLGDSNSVSVDTLAMVLRTFQLSPRNLTPYTERCFETVDAKGLHRVTITLIPLCISMRRATSDDCDAILQWRNAEETRKHVFDPEPILLENHRRWFQASLSNPDRIILIGEINGRAVGVLRYDFSGNEALVSVYLVPGHHGQGIGAELIRSGTRWLKEYRPLTVKINAEVLSANAVSRHAFLQAGYREHHVTYQEEVS